MTTPDYVVLVAYFIGMLVIGWRASRLVKGQTDFFLGGRTFGKLLQTFAAFGAGTGPSDPVNTSRTTMTSGVSGMWSVMSWLFVTPFYWFTGVWYRRMRTYTLADWFVERYESRALGAGFAVFGLFFHMVYTSMFFSAIGKVAASLMGSAPAGGGGGLALEYVLVPVIGLFVIVYGVMGGLRAAYWTDLIQGVFIIMLSFLLIPSGMIALVKRFGAPGDHWWDGFRVLHEQLPEKMFQIVGTDSGSEWPFYRIAAVALILLVGVVVQPHMMTTGGGSAKTELDARTGLVVGNLTKRVCTVGWVITALTVLALFGDDPELVADPDRAWGVATRELLAPGFSGLMLACMLAALMSSADVVMIVCAALVVRNIHVPFINPTASEAACVRLGRIVGALVIGGSVVLSWVIMNVYEQLELTWIVPMIFAAPFWIGMLWRRATTTAAWTTAVVVAFLFFILPWLAPALAPGLRTAEYFTKTTEVVETVSRRPAAPSDVRRRELVVAQWQEKSAAAQALPDATERVARMAAVGARPQPLNTGDEIVETSRRGGNLVYWSGRPVLPEKPQYREVSRTTEDGRQVVVLQLESPVKARGNFRPDFLIYDLLGIDLRTQSAATLAAMELPPKIFLPFFVMIAVSLMTRRNSPAALDRFYAKMHTEVQPDPQRDREELEKSYANPARFNDRKLLPRSDLEFMKPRLIDVGGFVGACAAVVGIIALVVLVTKIGA
jgi:solute:Na+ symporter, SSS family